MGDKQASAHDLLRTNQTFSSKSGPNTAECGPDITESYFRSLNAYRTVITLTHPFTSGYELPADRGWGLAQSCEQCVFDEGDEGAFGAVSAAGVEGDDGGVGAELECFADFVGGVGLVSVEAVEGDDEGEP